MADEVSGAAEAAEPDHWQQRAVERSLSDARTKAMTRSARFLEVAVELMNESGGFDFTVQELVDRSGLSLRAFYQHFGGKDELLLALFEEQMDRFLRLLAEDIAELEDPVQRMETFVEKYMERVRTPEVPGRSGRALTEFHLRLAATTPEAYAQAIRPQLAMMTALVEDGIAAGEFRTDIRASSMAVLMHTTLVSLAQMGILHVRPGAPISNDEVLAWCRAALISPQATGLAAQKKRIRVRR